MRALRFTVIGSTLVSVFLLFVPVLFRPHNFGPGYGQLVPPILFAGSAWLITEKISLRFLLLSSALLGVGGSLICLDGIYWNRILDWQKYGLGVRLVIQSQIASLLLVWLCVFLRRKRRLKSNSQYVS